MAERSTVTCSTPAAPALAGGTDPVRRHGYRLMAGLLVVVMLVAFT